MDINACLDILKARASSKHDGDDHSHAHSMPCVEENAARSLEVTTDAQNGSSEDFSSSTLAELVELFQACQTERVKVYQAFERGFGELMLSDKLPTFTQEITKQFAAISNRVNAIEKTLRSREKVSASLPDIIRKIQVEEKEKLLLTSALLLEKMRLKRAKDSDEEDPSIVHFERSIESMKKRHTEIVERINDFLQDLRYEVADEI